MCIRSKRSGIVHAIPCFKHGPTNWWWNALLAFFLLISRCNVSSMLLNIMVANSSFSTPVEDDKQHPDFKNNTKADSSIEVFTLHVKALRLLLHIYSYVSCKGLQFHCTSPGKTETDVSVAMCDRCSQSHRSCQQAWSILSSWMQSMRISLFFNHCSRTRASIYAFWVIYISSIMCHSFFWDIDQSIWKFFRLKNRFKMHQCVGIQMYCVQSEWANWTCESVWNTPTFNRC